MRKNSIKNTRINQEVQRELSTLIIRELKDPRIHPLTSIMKGLKSAAPFLRGQLAKTINLRNTPELHFIMDQSIEYGVAMSKLIDEVNQSTETEDQKVKRGGAYEK